MTTDTDLLDRVAELEERAQNFILARDGTDGWTNFIESRLLEEREYFHGLLTEVVAQLQRGIIAEVKAMLDVALAMRVRGTFQPGTVYMRGEVVAQDGASFISIKDGASAVCPGPHWQLLARQGSRGVRGERGERGLPGPKIVGWIVDRDAYTIRPKLDDGSQGPTLELKSLFDQLNGAPDAAQS